MAAVIPGGRSPMGLVDVLDEFECVVDARAHLGSEDDLEHDGPWVEVMIDGTTLPSEVCTEVGRSEFGIGPSQPQGYDNIVVELVPDPSEGGRQ